MFLYAHIFFKLKKGMFFLLNEWKKEKWRKSSVFLSFSQCVRTACVRF